MKSVAVFASCLYLSLFAFASEEMPAAVDVTSALTQSSTVTEPTVTTEKEETKAAMTAKSEDQIPLNIDQVKKASDSTPVSTRLFMTGIIISALLGSAYYFVKKYKISNTINKSNMQIKVLSQHYLGPKKSLAIVRVAGESILIGVTDSNISMIKSLSLLDDEIPAETPQNFADAMVSENARTKPTAPAAKVTMSAQASAMGSMNMDELEEEFSFSGLKDSVSKKLKSMRSI
jgi:flagellar protein FliO/FliZ